VPVRLRRFAATARHRAVILGAMDSNHCQLLKRKNLRDSDFLPIRQIRTKALVETRIEHATRVGSIASSVTSGLLNRCVPCRVSALVESRP